MGRVYSEIKVGERPIWTLFDTGSRNSYITVSAADGMAALPTQEPRHVALGGQTRTIDRFCNILGSIEDKTFEFMAFVTDNLSVDERGRPIDMLFGALAMQQWGIYPLPLEERLDLTHYSAEFVEY